MPRLYRGRISLWQLGIRGTEVAKEASDMILTDDRFPTIVDAVKKGRAIFDNIEKFVFFLFSCNIVEIITIFFAIAFNFPLPILALQILYLNLVVDILPAMSFAWEPAEKNIMQRAPRDPRKGIVNRGFLVHIMLSGTLIVFGSLAVFWHARSTGSSVELARTIGFTTLAAGSSRFNHPDRVHSADKNNREAHQTFLGVCRTFPE
jgi:Ca2+-transporting ATPase